MNGGINIDFANYELKSGGRYEVWTMVYPVIAYGENGSTKIKDNLTLPAGKYNIYTDNCRTVKIVNKATGTLLYESPSQVHIIYKSEADSTPPVIHGAEDRTITLGETFDPKEGVTATDDTDGDITSKITITGNVDNQTRGTYELIYNVSDSAGNMATPVKRTITVIAIGTTIACAPQTGDPAATVWQVASMLSAIVCLGLADVALRMRRRMRGRI